MQSGIALSGKDFAYLLLERSRARGIDADAVLMDHFRTQPSRNTQYADSDQR